MSIELILLIISAFITSSISAVTGMGGGVILLGIMAFFVPEGYMVIALHGIIQLFSNTIRTYVFRQYIKTNIIKDFFKGAIVGVLLSTLLIMLLVKFYNVQSADQIKFDFLKPVIGFFIIWYLFLKETKKNKKSKSFIWVGWIGGISSIFIGAIGPLIAPFFLDKSLSKENIIANKAACQMITHISKIPIFIIFFKVNYINEYSILLPLILAVYVGTNLGKRILSFISDKIFTTIFKVCLTLIALYLIWPLFGLGI